jgi:hypothetical protein
VSCAPLLERESEAAGRLVPLGLILFGICVVAGEVVRAFETSYIIATWHWIHHAWGSALQGAGAGTLGPVPTAPTGARILSFLMLPLEIVGLVFLLTFQHRAATTAKALGIPQRLSPTFGVVGWFIPLGQLVLPWMAWRDLLPRTHPSRSTVTALWLLLLAWNVTSILAVVLTITSTVLAGLCSAVGLILAILALRLTPSVVTAILETHRSGSQGSRAAAGDLPDRL